MRTNLRRITFLHLHRLVSERGWAMAQHPFLTLVRSARGQLYRLTTAAPSPEKGCLLIERYDPPMPYTDS